MNIRVDIIKTVEGLDGLRNDWAALLAVRGPATPFETFEWTKANLVSFPGQGRRVIVVRDGPEVAGILPLALRSKRKYLRRRVWLEFAGLPFADYGTCLVKPGFETLIAKAFIDYVGAEEASACAYLDGLRRSDLFSNALMRAAGQQGIEGRLVATYEISRLRRPAEIDEMATGLQSRSLGKSRRKLSEIGEISFEVRTDEAKIQDGLEAYFRMHIERCAAKDAICPLANPEQQQFFRNVVRYCAPAGLVWLSTLSCAGQPVASRFSLRCGDALHLYSTCFAPAFAKYSPSMLQLEMLVQYAFANGIRVIDFGIGDSPQKGKAGAIAEQPMVRVELYRSRVAYWESRLFLAAQERAKHVEAVHTGGKLIRRLLPHQA